MKKKYNVMWFGPMTEPSGYGVASRNYIRQLVKYKDIQLKLINRLFWAGDKLDLGEEQDFFEELSDVQCLKGLPTIVIYHLTPDHYKIIPGVDKHVCLTTFETDSIPDYWLPNMKLMDEVWTFTNFNKETFSNAKINRPIKVINHGVDTKTYRPNIEPISELKEITENKYVFGSIFDWHGRKNPELLIESYLRAFDGKDADKVVLLLKTFYSHKKDGNAYIENEIKKIRDKVYNELKNKAQPKIVLLSNILKQDDLPKFYNSIDCYVSSSKGEGWGLPLSEAMACELPVIATGWGGNMEFMTNDNSFLLPYELVNVDENDSKHHPYFKSQKWADIKMDDLIALFQKVFYNKEEAKKVGKKAREDVKKFSWETAGKVMYENIKRILCLNK